MDVIAARAQSYKTIALRLDPDYSDILRHIETVKQFIVDNDCIIYGGTAIDYALRLRGDSIYKDDALDVPDLDFYSHDSVGNAYKLADILYRSGAAEARAVVAVHIETMRVDSGRNHFIADISYLPKSIEIPTVVYSGMKCVHPDFQRGDLHSALAFPFDNAPREVIFDRWKKDVERLNKIDACYPIAPPAEFEMPATETHKYARDVPLYGWAAYSALVHGRGATVPATAQYRNGALIFNTANGLELVCATPHALAGAMRYYPYTNLVFERYTGVRGRPSTTFYSTEHRLISTVQVTVSGVKMQSVCAQGVLHYMLGMWFFTRNAVYLAAYYDLWELVKAGDDPALGLSLETYGDDNINHAQLVQISQAQGVVISGKPSGYIPAKGKDPQPFNYEAEFFRIDGAQALVEQ